MAITLIVNPGSSSKKFALYKEGVLVLSSYIERSEDGFEMCVSVGGVQQRCELVSRHKFQESLGKFLENAKERKIIINFSEVSCVAVRVVSPGTFFQSHREIDDIYIKRLREQESSAPLHIPHVLSEIKIIKEVLPDVRIMSASDSAFHATIPDYIRQYSLQKEESKKYDIYRFGYHGLSVSSVVKRIHSITGVDSKKAVVCHIGSGVSVTAVKDYMSFDTTMGYSPGSGLLMGSRAGDLDVGALLALMKIQNLKPMDAQTYIQNYGGLRGLTGESDLRLILEKSSQGDKNANEAISAFVYHIQKSIGAYMAVLGGLDTLVFTATAGERSSTLRSLVVEELKGLGIELDSDKNELCISRDGVISKSSSSVKVLVIKTDEANEILRICNS
jgi:acetate kinase